MDLSRVEVPRLVKKPGAHKRVETLADLESALKDGWVLRLDPAAETDAPDPAPPLTADQDRTDAESQPHEPPDESDGVNGVEMPKRHAGGKKK